MKGPGIAVASQSLSPFNKPSWRPAFSSAGTAVCVCAESSCAEKKVQTVTQQLEKEPLPVQGG